MHDPQRYHVCIDGKPICSEHNTDYDARTREVLDSMSQCSADLPDKAARMLSDGMRRFSPRLSLVKGTCPNAGH